MKGKLQLKKIIDAATSGESLQSVVNDFRELHTALSEELNKLAQVVKKLEGVAEQLAKTNQDNNAQTAQFSDLLNKFSDAVDKADSKPKSAASSWGWGTIVAIAAPVVAIFGGWWWYSTTSTSRTSTPLSSLTAPFKSLAKSLGLSTRR